MVPVLSAQAPPVNADLRTLTSLYAAALKRTSPDPYLEKRIADERLKLRAQAEQEIQAITEAATRGDTDLSSSVRTFERQQTIVASLEDLRKNRHVDIDLLSEEEKTYYLSPATETGSTTEWKTTASYGELKARVALAEEYIAALDVAITLQQDRLDKLTSAQRWEQFSGAIQIGGYLLILLAGIALDRLIRRRFLRRIHDRNRRYVATKLVSATITTLTVAVLLGRVLREYPQALSSLAIIGAGIAIALQDVIKDIVSWIIILQRRLYTLGDRISIGQFTGDVVDIGFLRTTLLDASMTQSGAVPAYEQTGKLLAIPNSILLREPLTNFSAASDFIAAEITLTVAYTKEWPAIRDIITTALRDTTAAFSDLARKQQRRRTSLFYTSWEASEPTVHVSISSQGIVFVLTFLAPIGKRRETQTHLSDAVLQSLLSTYEITSKDNILTLTRKA